MASPPRHRWRHALWLVVVPVALNAATGVYMAAVGMDEVAFREGAGEDLASFEARYPRVVATADAQERLIGVLLASFSTLGLLAAWQHRGEPTAGSRWILATMPSGFGAVAVVMLAAGTVDVGGYYVGVALLTGLGAFLAGEGREAAPKPVAA